ncbi:MAG: asparagine synthase (glutamine-hydrolyzing) [Nitrospirota bacterium]
MCGIVGIVNFRNEVVDPSVVGASANMLVKRGPDGFGVWARGNAGLGHRRLSILDVTSTGAQPMTSEDGRFVITYNGEIYNFRELRKEIGANIKSWRGTSDTEVALAAYTLWGPDCVKLFHGMFAFAIWDRKEEVLFAARDRMGVKPFYYLSSDECFAFASRPRALFGLHAGITRELDITALRLYLESGYIPAPYSIYRAIKKLPPSSYMLVSKKEARLQRYWDFRSIEPELSWSERSEAELLDELDHIVSRNVHSRMVSDVPLGAFLSGGIDSSLVVALMAKHSPRPVKTFTIGFPDKIYDESGYAEAVARHLGTEHYCEYLQVDDLLKLVPTFCEEFDEPFFDYSAFPTMAVSRLAREHVAVSLSGDGGDELFGGYHYYQIIQKLHPLFRLPAASRKFLAGLAGMLPQHQFRLLSGALRQPSILAAFAFSRSIAKDFPTLLLPEALEGTTTIYELFGKASASLPSGLHPSEQCMRLDAIYTLPDDYLQKVDVASMTFSLESREPLLDQDLVEWAMKLPLSWKTRGHTNKYLLRKLAYRYIPAKLLDRPKQGFSVPIDKWLRGAMKDWAMECICDPSLFRKVPLSQPKVLELFELHCNGARNAHPLLWAVLMLLKFISISEGSRADNS